MRLPIDPDKDSMSQNGHPMLVTVEEAARLLRIGRTTAIRARDGRKRSPSVKVGLTSARRPCYKGVLDYVCELLQAQNQNQIQRCDHPDIQPPHWRLRFLAGTSSVMV